MRGRLNPEFQHRQRLRGGITADGVALETSDGLAASGERHLEIAAAEPAELMLFELG